MMNRRFFVAGIAMLTVAPMARAAILVSSGTMVGQAGHTASGTVNIVDEGSRKIIHLTANFKFDGGPDVKVALGKDGYDPRTLLAPLSANSGSQAYVIPDHIDPSAYNQVWLWCEQFNVGLAMAPMK